MQTTINVHEPIQQPSSVPTVLASLEMADLSAQKRNTIIYERSISDLSNQAKRLSEQNTRLNEKLLCLTEENAKIPQLKRGKTEMYISSAVSTILMAIGGGLISSFPILADGKIPYQFAIGWTLLALAILLGALMRPLVWVVYYKLVCKQGQPSLAIASAD